MQSSRRESNIVANVSSVTPTLCALSGIEPPRASDTTPLEAVIDYAQRERVGTVERIFVFAPDALGRHLRLMHSESFRNVLSYAPLEISLSAVMPTLTPVNFASMFTGAPPHVHGIEAYEKPPLSCDTLFDALVRTGRKAAIVAVKESSIDLIFRKRNIDYFSEKYDDDVTARVLSLLEINKHDFILAYQQEYDDVMHETAPCSESAIRAMKNHIDAFGKIARAADCCWSTFNHAILFAPDHGTHVDPVSGKGTHGTDCREDMLIQHFYGIKKADVEGKKPAG